VPSGIWKKSHARKNFANQTKGGLVMKKGKLILFVFIILVIAAVSSGCLIGYELSKPIVAEITSPVAG
jgi:hypothetical protein